MIYRVLRTSELFENVNPIRGTFKDKVTTKPHPDWPEETIYYLEINSIEELQKLIKEEGTIVLGDNNIEIYDDYRE